RRRGDRMMHRRELITLLGAAAMAPAAWPRAAAAEQRAIPLIGFILPDTPGASAPRIAEFRRRLSASDYVEGQNIAIEYRWAGGRYDRLRAIAAELVRRQVTIIVPPPIPAALAAKAATSSIPIVFNVAADPVEVGLVASLARPGGNATGV